MRLGGPVTVETADPTAWAETVVARGYRATQAPIGPDADAETAAAYRQAAASADVEIAEIGAWGYNPISDDPDEREAGVDAAVRALELADELGARCAVNVAGSRGETWDAPHPDNFSQETFERIVTSVREIVDRADPDDAVYALEPMPWVPPHSIESQRRLLDAIDREAIGVHFDPVNLLTSPERVARNGEFVREFVEAFGTDIDVVHLKDARLRHELTVHVEEVVPGDGTVDIHALLTALDNYDLDIPVLLEHLDSEDAYERAAQNVREVADEAGVSL